MAELIEEEHDDSMVADLEQGLAALQKKLESFELTLLLSNSYDKYNAILELHPGAGGTESQDWAGILLRMYRRWADNKGFKVEAAPNVFFLYVTH